jgi:hypothetical protein
MTSSPELTMAIREEIMASVAPQQTVISLSGSMVTPLYQANFSVMA